MFSESPLLNDQRSGPGVSTAEVWVLIRVWMFGSVNGRALPKLRLASGSSAPYAARTAARFARSAPRAWTAAGAFDRARRTASSRVIGTAASIAAGAMPRSVVRLESVTGVCARASPAAQATAAVRKAPIAARRRMLKLILEREFMTAGARLLLRLAPPKRWVTIRNEGAHRHSPTRVGHRLYPGTGPSAVRPDGNGHEHTHGGFDEEEPYPGDRGEWCSRGSRLRAEPGDDDQQRASQPAAAVDGQRQRDGRDARRGAPRNGRRTHGSDDVRGDQPHRCAEGAGRLAACPAPRGDGGSRSAEQPRRPAEDDADDADAHGRSACPAHPRPAGRLRQEHAADARAA